MTDQDKQRIEKAAWENRDNEYYSDCKYAHGFIAGAEYEHPHAYNKALEDVIDFLSQTDISTHLRLLLSKELQKMRK